LIMWWPNWGFPDFAKLQLLSGFLQVFVFHWRQVIVSGMGPDSVIEYLYIFKDRMFGLLSGFKFMVVGTFRFRGVEETFRNGVIPAVSLSAHALEDSVVSDNFPVAG
jgi:hypothetical protein